MQPAQRIFWLRHLARTEAILFGNNGAADAPAIPNRERFCRGIVVVRRAAII